MNIDCILIAEKGQIQVKLPLSMLTELAKTLRIKGKETVVTMNSKNECEEHEVNGVYIAAKGSKGLLMVVNGDADD